MSTVQTTLLRAAELIETVGWTQGAFARRPNGEPTSATEYQPLPPSGSYVVNSEATCFCLWGAIEAAAADLVPTSADLRYSLCNEAIARVAKLVPHDPDADAIVRFNDNSNRTVDEVVEVLRKAASEAPA